MAKHEDAKLTVLLQTLANCPRARSTIDAGPSTTGLRRASAADPPLSLGRGHTISISAEALAAIEVTLPDGRVAELWQDVRDLIHGKVEAWDASYEILRHSGAAGLR